MEKREPNQNASYSVKINEKSLKKLEKISWPGNKSEAGLVLTKLRYLTEKTDFLNDQRLSNKLQNQLLNWNLIEIMQSALIYKYQNISLTYLDWNLILCLLLNPVLSNCLISMLKENEFNEISEKDKVVCGAIKLFEKNIILYLEKDPLTNFLNFLRIDSSKIPSLVSYILEENDLTDLLEILKNKDYLLLNNCLTSPKAMSGNYSKEKSLISKNVINYFSIISKLALFFAILYNLFSNRNTLVSKKIEENWIQSRQTSFAYLSDSWMNHAPKNKKH